MVFFDEAPNKVLEKGLEKEVLEKDVTPLVDAEGEERGVLVLKMLGEKLFLTCYFGEGDSFKISGQPRELVKVLEAVSSYLRAQYGVKHDEG